MKKIRRPFMIDYGGPECREAAACGASALCDHRGECKTDPPLQRQQCDRRHPSGRLGVSDGPDHHGAEKAPA